MTQRARQVLMVLAALLAGAGVAVATATFAGAEGTDPATCTTTLAADGTCPDADTVTTQVPPAEEPPPPAPDDVPAQDGEGTTAPQTTPTSPADPPADTTPTSTAPTDPPVETPPADPPADTTPTPTTPATPPAATTPQPPATAPAQPTVPTDATVQGPSATPAPPVPDPATLAAPDGAAHPVTAEEPPPPSSTALAAEDPAEAADAYHRPARPSKRRVSVQDARPDPSKALPGDVTLPDVPEALLGGVFGNAFAGTPIDASVFGPLLAPAFGADAATSIPFPTWLLNVYQAAGNQYGVPWPVLASINQIETNFGKNARVSSAGATGWMQFMPSTWAHYGVDASGDGVADPRQPTDAIFAAARYLRAAGAGKDLARAIYAYNHAGWYVKEVLDGARKIAGLRADLLTTLTQDGAETGRKLLEPDAKIDSFGRAMLLDDKHLQDFVLGDPHISIYECGRQDIAAGVVDRRILLVLAALRFSKLDPTVSSLRCGHGYLTAGGNVSEHSGGDAVDIAAINGVSMLGHQGAGSITDTAVRRILKLQGALDPHQIITLMVYKNRPETLALADHNDHIHVGFHARRALGSAADSVQGGSDDAGK